jgi:hypothetical protein
MNNTELLNALRERLKFAKEMASNFKDTGDSSEFENLNKMLESADEIAVKLIRREPKL